MFDSLFVSSDPKVQGPLNHLYAVWSCCSVFFGMIIIVSPLILKDTLGSESASSYQGFLTSCTAASGAVFSILFGYCSDKMHSRAFFIRLWVLAFLISAAFLIHSETSRTLPGLIFARLVPFSVFSALTYSAASDFCSEDSALVIKAHSFITFCFSASMLVGNVLAASFSKLEWKRVSILSFGACFVVIAAVVAFFFLSDASSSSSSKSSSKIQQDEKEDEEKEQKQEFELAPKQPEEKENNLDVDDEEEESEESQEAMIVSEKKMSESEKENKTRRSNRKEKKKKKKKDDKGKNVSFFDGIRLLQSEPLLLNNIIAYALLRVSNVNSFSVWTIYTAHRFNFQLHQMASFLLCLGTFSAIFQLLSVRYFSHLEKMPDSHKAGQQLLFLFFLLLILAPILCLLYGLVTSGTMMFLLTPLGGVVSVVPSIFTTKIACLSQEKGLTGFSLGLVGSMQNSIEIFLGWSFGKLLQISIKHFQIDDVWFGLPYFVNCLVYLLIFLIVWFSHHRYGTHSRIWMEFHANPKIT